MLVVSLLFAQAAALSLNSVDRRPAPTRRGFLERGTAACASLAVVSAPAPSWAANDGQLPDGPLQFDRFLKVQADWSRLGPRMMEIEETEWEGVRLFLRKLYLAGDDMNYLSKNLDATKKAQAKELANAFQLAIKKADRLAASKDRDAVAQLYTTTSVQMKDFLVLLQDIPDEL
ncbi:hypothetical protein M885DRAFT_505701 [Pelagophyceae sp. CCMP2097]|nr:hypothetical protein M885DRAFT_505701 [Pelagophyceae sp. CCMP2097]|mmetsp:Transcript_12120/g.40443  ORF Transcript_12120/g.40443 Transcript_12120/m.40443 type:complete len:174 (+) Transcript_12120:64-585(+)